MYAELEEFQRGLTGLVLSVSLNTTAVVVLKGKDRENLADTITQRASRETVDICFRRVRSILIFYLVSSLVET